MGSYVIRLKVLPEDTSTDLSSLAKAVSASLPANSQLRSQKVEPIAFGLSALLIDVVAPEEEGAVDAVESAVAGTPNVSQCEVTGVSRMSSKLPPQ